MSQEQIETIHKILYMIINSIDRNFYDIHISGLSDDDYEKCTELLKSLKKEESL